MTDLSTLIWKDEEVEQMRQIARNIARETMRRAGFKNFNRKRHRLGGRSSFSIHWRDAALHALNNPGEVYAGE